MTERARVELQALFESGDTITQTTMGDLIDSSLNLVDTTAQSFGSNLQVPAVQVSAVSAASTYATNTFGNLIRVSALQHKAPYAQMVMKNVPTTGANPHTLAIVGVSSLHELLCFATSDATNMSGFTATTSGRLTYIGATTAIFNVEYNFSLYSNTASEANWALWLYKTGVRLTASQARFSTVGNQWEFTNVRTVVKMVTNDYIQAVVWVTTTAAATLTVVNFDAIAFPLYWDY